MKRVEVGIVTLNPADVSTSVLERLNPVLVFYALSGPENPNTICSRTGAGWNDCFSLNFSLNATVHDMKGIVMQGYIDETGLLEVYLTDEAASLDKPVASLVSIRFAQEELDMEHLSVRIDLDTAKISDRKFDEAALVGEIVDLTPELAEDPYWNVEHRPVSGET